MDLGHFPSDTLPETPQWICCGSILSLVQIIFSFVFSIVMYDNDFETKENKIWTKDKIEPQQIYNIL